MACHRHQHHHLSGLEASSKCATGELALDRVRVTALVRVIGPQGGNYSQLSLAL